MAKKRSKTKDQDQEKEKDQGKYQAKNDAYTGMLTLSLFALIGGCVLLYLDYDTYKGTPPPGPQQEKLVSPDDPEGKDANPFSGILEEPAPANPNPPPMP